MILHVYLRVKHMFGLHLCVLFRVKQQFEVISRVPGVTPGGVLAGPPGNPGPDMPSKTTLKRSRSWPVRSIWDHLVTKALKRSKRAFWMSPGAIWWPRRQNAQIKHSGCVLGPFGGRGAKALKMSILGVSWDHLVAKAPKRSK